jgi:hypothetical protein
VDRLGASRCGLCFVGLRFLHYLGVGSRIDDALWAPDGVQIDIQAYRRMQCDANARWKSK